NFSFFVASGSNKDGIKKTASRDYDDTRLIVKRLDATSKAPKDAKLVNLSSPHLELLRQVIIQEEQEQAKEKVLLTERKKERMKKIKEHNQKAEYVIVDIKGK
ncbi:6096_t:CDS:2, partial [Racocetra persica]